MSEAAASKTSSPGAPGALEILKPMSDKAGLPQLPEKSGQNMTEVKKWNIVSTVSATSMDAPSGTSTPDRPSLIIQAKLQNSKPPQSKHNDQDEDDDTPLTSLRPSITANSSASPTKPPSSRSSVTGPAGGGPYPPQLEPSATPSRASRAVGAVRASATNNNNSNTSANNPAPFVRTESRMSQKYGGISHQVSFLSEGGGGGGVVGGGAGHVTTGGQTSRASVVLPPGVSEETVTAVAGLVLKQFEPWMEETVKVIRGMEFSIQNLEAMVKSLERRVAAKHGEQWEGEYDFKPPVKLINEPGVGGEGAIGGAGHKRIEPVPVRTVCIRCEGLGFHHASSDPKKKHDKPKTTQCRFCRSCSLCQKAGVLMNTMPCVDCKGAGSVHQTVNPLAPPKKGETSPSREESSSEIKTDDENLPLDALPPSFSPCPTLGREDCPDATCKPCSTCKATGLMPHPKAQHRSSSPVHGWTPTGGLLAGVVKGAMAPGAAIPGMISPMKRMNSDVPSEGGGRVSLGAASDSKAGGPAVTPAPIEAVQTEPIGEESGLEGDVRRVSVASAKSQK